MCVREETQTCESIIQSEVFRISIQISGKCIRRISGLIQIHDNAQNVTDLSLPRCQLSHQVWWISTYNCTAYDWRMLGNFWVCQSNKYDMMWCENILSRNGQESGKVILDPHLESDQHQKLTTSRGPPLAHAYQAWSTSSRSWVILRTICWFVNIFIHHKW